MRRETPLTAARDSTGPLTMLSAATRTAKATEYPTMSAYCGGTCGKSRTTSAPTGSRRYAPATSASAMIAEADQPAQEGRCSSHPGRTRR